MNEFWEWAFQIFHQKAQLNYQLEIFCRLQCRERTQIWSTIISLRNSEWLSWPLEKQGGWSSQSRLSESRMLYREKIRENLYRVLFKTSAEYWSACVYKKTTQIKERTFQRIVGGNTWATMKSKISTCFYML